MMPKSRLAPGVGDNLSLTPTEPEDAPDTSVWSKDGAAGAETTVAPPATVAAQELAWSADAEVIEHQRQSWGQAWSAAAIVVLCCAVVALAIWGLALLRSGSGGGAADETARPTITATAYPTTASTMAAAALPAISPKTSDPDVVAPPTTVTQPPTTVTVRAEPPPPVTFQAQPPAPSRDDEFLERLQADQLVIHNRAEALNGARWVCKQLSAGRTQADVVASAELDNPTVTHLGTVDFVSTSAAFYCPEYAGN
jgi:hypothetical protein